MPKVRMDSNGRIIIVNETTVALCPANITPFSAPQSGNGAMGDLHYVFGNDLETNGVAMASFNVDDNDGTNSLIWFYAKVGSIEYAISYTQQDFAFTANGKSIDSITISETGQSDILYTLNAASGADQTQCLKDGVLLSVLDSFTLGNNIAKIKILPRIIPPSSNCDTINFGLFHLDVHFADGLYNVDEVGGALYYIWKKAKDEVGVQNTSSADAVADGIGLYLNGFEGFSNRSQFEVLTSEVKDSPTIEGIAVKFNELAGSNGTWTADWDPLVADIPSCASPILGCGTVNGDPTLFITVAWDGVDATKSFLDCTWSNGETKEVYATNYGKDTDGSVTGFTTVRFESWQRHIGSNNQFQLNGYYRVDLTYSSTPFVTQQALRGWMDGTLNNFATVHKEVGPYHGTLESSMGGVWNPSAAGLNPVAGDGYLDANKAGTISHNTGSETITITWSEANNW